MNKPVTVVREELRQTIASAVNDANLPAFVVADMFDGFLRELRALEQKQYEADVRAYKESEDNEDVHSD